MSGRWHWDKVFEHLVYMCDKHGGYYQLSIEEGAQFKDGQVGEGWGEYNLRQKIIPRYQKYYTDYEFGVSGNRKYLWCKRKTGLPPTLRYRETPVEEQKYQINEPSEDAYIRAVNALRNIKPKSIFIFGKWEKISENDLKKIAILRICSSQTRVSNLRNLEYSPDLNKLVKGPPEKEISAILRKHGIRFPEKKTKWIKNLLSLDIVSLIQKMKTLSGKSLSQERKARKQIVKTINGIGLKTASDFLKDIGFSKYLAVLDSRNLKFLQNMELAPKHLKPNDLSKQIVYYKLEEVENKLAKKIGITVSELDEKIMAYTGEERPHKI